jgi:membrane dipeptidase
MTLDRRSLLVGGLATPLAASLTAPALAEGSAPVFIGDMHYHLFFFGKTPATVTPLRRTMAAGNATLVSWSLVGDVPWLRPAKGGFKQTGSPKNPGESLTWFDQELARIKTHLTAQNLKVATTAAHLDLALKGEPHVVLSVEGATFVDEDIKPLQKAYDEGIRHIQLVHYIRNPIGDFQTEKPQHQGLTSFGREVIAECNRLGILVDLAHCTHTAVMQALEASKAPMVWSHSSVTRGRMPAYSMPVWQARQLSLDGAKAIAAKGGVVGLWALRADVGRSIESYADRMTQMADWLGEDHVAFGTDLNALANPVVTSYADLQRVVRHWQRRRVDPARIRKLAIENYANVLRKAFAARTA